MKIIESKNYKLILADCSHCKDHWKDKADLIVCDPPYKLTKGGATKGGLHERMGGDYKNDGNIVECNLSWQEIMDILYESLKTGKHAYVMANNRNVLPLGNAAESAGFGFHNWLVWDKRAGTANRWYMKTLEFTGFFYKQSTFQINDCSSNQLISHYQKDVSDHPTEKPVPLMEHYISNSSQPGDTVIDHFMGSGTTGVAAINLGRKFIGIELDEKYFNIAAKRLDDAERNFQMRMF